MIELFPNPQLRLRAAPPIITGIVAIFIFVAKLPRASAMLAILATIGLLALCEGLYLLLVSRSPAVVLDGDGISVRSRIPFGRTRRISWRELRGGQTVRRQFIRARHDRATVPDLERVRRRRPSRVVHRPVRDGSAPPGDPPGTEPGRAHATSGRLTRPGGRGKMKMMIERRFNFIRTACTSLVGVSGT